MVSAWINLMLQSAMQKNHSLSKAVTMGHFFIKLKESCWTKVYKFKSSIEDEILKKKNNFAKNCFKILLFLTLKHKNQTYVIFKKKC